MSSPCKNDRVAVANVVLQSFAPDTTVRIDATGYVIVEWTRRGGEKLSRRWMTRGQDWYPVWHRHWGHGGTASCALSQLVRWIQGRPVCSLAAWRNWASPQCALLRQQDDNGESALKALADAGYPEKSPCVLCGDTEHIGDWWSLNGVSGPCCSWRSGCRQERKGGAS